MNFQPDLAVKSVGGWKTVTRRRMSTNPRSPWSSAGCRLVVGQDYAVCPGRGKESIGRIEIVRIDAVRLGDTTEDEAQLEGFRSLEEFVAIWSNINRGWNDDERVWRVEYRAVQS